MSNCTTPYPPIVVSRPIDAAMGWASVFGCIATIAFGSRVLYMYSMIRSKRWLDLAVREANDAVIDMASDWFQQRLRMFRAGYNLRNDAIVFCIATLVVWSAVHIYFFVAMLVRYYTPGSAENPTIAWNKFYYTVNECRVSAIADQYFTTACCMLAIMYTYGLTFSPFRQPALFWWSQLVSIGSTLALWYGSNLDERAHTAYMFFAGMPWCWLADGGGLWYAILKFVSAYAFYLFIWVFGIMALWSLRRRLHSRQRARLTIDIRLAPQIMAFMLIFACGGVMRFIIPRLPDDDQEVPRDTFAMLFVIVYTFHGALTSLAWAFGEGLHWALLMPWRYSIMNLEEYTDPFSSIASQVLNDNASSTSAGLGTVEERLNETSADSDTPCEAQVHGSAARFVRRSLPFDDDDSSHPAPLISPLARDISSS